MLIGKLLSFLGYTNSSPSNGDLWYDGTDFNVRTGGATKALLGGTIPVANGGTGYTSFPVIAKVKAADESVTSSAVLQNDDALFFAIGANETWQFTMQIKNSCGATGLFKWAFTLPSGATGFCNVNGNFLGSLTMALDLTTGGAYTGGAIAATGMPAILTGYVVNSSNAGTVQFQFAQNVSNGTATIVHKSSTLTAIRVS